MAKERLFPTKHRERSGEKERGRTKATNEDVRTEREDPLSHKLLKRTHEKVKITSVT